MTKVHNIAKNTSYLTLALIFQKIISFTYFTLLARFLGPEDLGRYYFAISFTTIFAILIDLGLANVLIREIAKEQTKAARLLGNVLLLKLPLALIAVGGAVMLINFSTVDPVVRILVYISAAAMVLDSFTATFFAAVRGFHNLKYESIASIVFQLIVLVLGYGALLAGKGLAWAMAALAAASVFNFLYSWYTAAFKIGIKVRLYFHPELLRRLAIISWPFAAYAIFQRLYLYLDSVLLAYFSGNEQVGLYQVAFKIIFALQFLPLAFTASLYPALSAYWQNNREQLAITFERSLNYLTIISWPIVVGIFLLADQIVLLFKDGYGGAVQPLQLTIIALFFIFLNFPIGSLLNACDRQKRNTLNMGIVMVVSVILNLILIPKYQAVGAAAVVLFSNALMFILGAQAVRGVIIHRWTKNLKVLLKVLLASGLMSLLIIATKNFISIFMLVPLAGIIYFYALFLLHGFSREDVVSVFKSLKI